MGRVIGLGICLLLVGCATRGPEDSSEVITEARAAMQQKRWSTGLRHLDGIGVRDAEVQTLRGQCLRQLGRSEEAQSAYFAVLGMRTSRDDQRSEAARALGEMALEGGDSLQASLRFENALSFGLSGKERDLARLGLCRCALARDDHDAARGWLRRLEEGPSKESRALNGRLRSVRKETPVAAKSWKPTRRPARRSSAPAIIDRSEWRAAAAIRNRLDPMGRLRYITVHHTGERGDRGSTLSRSQAAARLRSLQSGHQGKWADIGYHFLIDRSGRIWEGRELRWQGAHAGNSNANRNNVGIALIGNFDRYQPPRAQVRSLESLLRWLVRDKRIAATTIRGHDSVRKLHGLGGTACPGRHLVPHVERLQRTLARESAALETFGGSELLVQIGMPLGHDLCSCGEAHQHSGS